MKRITFTLAALLFALAGPLSLPAIAEEPPADTAAASPASEEYEQSMKERLGTLGARLETLKKEIEAGSEQAGAKLKEQLAEAEIELQAAARKFAEMGKGSSETWEKFSAEVDKAAKNLEQLFERSRTRQE